MNQPQTSRVTLRAPNREDAPAISVLRNQPGVRHGTLALPFSRIETSEDYLAKRDPNLYLIIAEAGSELTGMASLNRYTGRRSHAAGLGVNVADAWHRRGVGTALVAALIDLADNWLGLTRIELNVFPDNEAAIALYQKFDFITEGRQRGYALRDGVLIDSLSMARLRV